VAKQSTSRSAWRPLIWLLVLIVALIGANGAGVLWSGASWTPKLALDLEGGTQIVLTPTLQSGETVSEEQLTQAVSIIRQRIDAAGVSESEINTQGSNNIVVSIPGQPDDQTLARIQASAKLDFRPVLIAGAPSSEQIGPDGATITPSYDPTLPNTPSIAPSNGSDLNWITPELQSRYLAFTCGSEAAGGNNAAPADEPLVTCDDTNTAKFILGPVELDGSDISDATAGLITTQTGSSTGQWAVNLVFNPAGTTKFADITARLNGLQGSLNQFAIVLDGNVISAPATKAVISDGKPQISGGFTQESAKTLADQLKYGALPIGFEVQSSDTISATLGSTQLQSGLLAGLIGLILVVVYSLIQYRTLGLVTVFSLAVAAVITYLLVTLLSWREGYRLSLAGVAGLIVAIGITADSFIVYFERIRDELRDGRGLESAVENGWRRAIRTIVASDAVNFLAAGVLFILAVGNVRGFALTLGLTTIVDLFVVSLFTHPVLRLLSRSNFFASGHPLSGLDPVALGAVYRGRAQFASPSTARVSAGKAAKSSKEAARRQTIAERRAAAPNSDSSTKGGE
jgi:preprotein translocase subunit SecD